MSLSEEAIPSGDDGDSVINGGGIRRKNDAKKSFDLEAFHQLRLERFENQRRAEEVKLQRYDRRLDWNSNASLPSRNSPLIQTVRSRSFQPSSSSFETEGVVDTLSARQELLCLGRRHASQERRLPPSMTEQATWVKKNEHHVESQALFPSPTNGSSANALEIGHRFPQSDSGDIHASPRCLDINSRSSSAPIEILSQYQYHDGGISVVTPDEQISSKEDFRRYSSHYLLLARTNSPPPIHKTEYRDADGSIAVDDEDGSSSASYNTPAPHLQAASACNSHGENEDVCEGHHRSYQKEDVQEEFDHFSSFCRAQVMISEIEHNSSKKLEQAPMCPSVKANLGQSHRTNTERLLYYVVQPVLVIIVGAAIYFCGRYTTRWYMVSYPGLSPAMFVSAQFKSRLDAMPTHDWSFEAVQSALDSKMVDGLEQISFFREHLTSRVILLAKLVWSTPIALFTDWWKDVDVLSWIIETIYRLEKTYYDALQLLDASKYRFLEVQDSSAVAWNMTLSVAVSCWHHFNSEQLSCTHNDPIESQERVMIRKSTLTAPLVFWISDGNLSNRSTWQNDTMASLPLDSKDAVKLLEKSSSPLFWRATIKGKPFVRHQLSSTRHRYLHSIPSSGSQMEADYALVSISPLFSRIRHPNDRPIPYSFPVVGLKHSHFSLEDPRLNSIAISSDKKSRPRKHSEDRQLLVAEKRNYYLPSYPSEGQPDEIGVFEDVDVMGIASEFFRKVWQRKPSRKRSRRKASTSPRRRR